VNATALLLIVLVFLLIGLDILFATGVLRTPTISADVRDWVAKSPWTIFALGFLMGHLLWPQPPAH
jgi:hypothetical protein